MMLWFWASRQALIFNPMKKLGFLCISFFLLCFLFGCANSKGDRNTLNVVMSLTEEEWQVMRSDIFPRFESTHNCKISAYQVEASDWIKKLEAMVKGGNVKVDVFSQDNMRLYPLVDAGLVLDLTDYTDRIPEEISETMSQAGVFGGKTYFFPYRANVQIVYYNEEQFTKYGLKLPEDWPSLLKVAEVFKESEGIGKVGLKLWGGTPTATQVYEMIISAGGDPFKFNDEGCLETMRFLKKLYPYLSPESRKAKWDTTNTYLANESFYIAQNWPFGINVIVRDYEKEEIKVYSGWSGPVKQAHIIGGEVLGIPKGAGNIELALEFISYMESRQVQQIFVERLGWPSVRNDAYNEIVGWQREYFEAIKEALSFGVWRPNVLYWGEFEKFINEALMRIVIEGEDPAGVLDEYHVRMNEVIYAYGSKIRRD